MRRAYATLLAGIAATTLLASPAVAQRAPAGAALEARVKALEEELRALRDELRAARTEAQSATAQAAAAQTAAQAQQASVAAAAETNAKVATQVATLEKRTASDGFRVGPATIKITGYVKADTLFSDFSSGEPGNVLARDYYLPGAIPVGPRAAGEGGKFNFHAKQTRLALNISAPVGGHTVGGYVEGDFEVAPGTQGDTRVSNGYDFGVRRAYLTFDNWLFGQEWTTFQNTATLPETADYIGPSEGTVFARQAQVRYTHKLSPTANLQLAVENPETSVIAGGAMAPQFDSRMPDVVARVNVTSGPSSFALAGIARQIRVRTADSFDESSFGWGVSLSGKLAFGPNNRDDIRFMLTGGRGIGRYVGLNFAPDALVVNAPGLQDVQNTGILAGFVALRHFWTDKWRSTAAFSIQRVDNPALAPSTWNRQAWSAFGNIFYSPVKNLDLGLEYRHGERELESGVDGNLDRVHFVAKASF